MNLAIFGLVFIRVSILSYLFCDLMEFAVFPFSFDYFSVISHPSSKTVCFLVHLLAKKQAICTVVFHWKALNVEHSILLNLLLLIFSVISNLQKLELFEQPVFLRLLLDAVMILSPS
jgi:hypothetical protein